MKSRILLFFTLYLIFILENNKIQCNKQVSLPKLNKCCLSNEYVQGPILSVRKVCNSSDKSINFSQIKIFKYKEGTTVYDNFDIVPGMFYKDEVFRKKSTNTMMLRKFNVFLAENGLLYIEKPNAYNRLTIMHSNNFCVDFHKNKEVKPTATFWVVHKTNNKKEKKNFSFITIAAFVSSFFLLLVLIVYALLPELRNLCGLILMAYVASLLSAFLLLGIIRMKVHSDIICYNLTLAIYFFILESFCWMNVMSFDIWWTFRGYVNAHPIHRRGVPFKYLMYSIYAWSLPTAMTIMLAWIDGRDMRDTPWFVKPNLLKEGCFLGGGEQFLYLYIPMLILICCNWLFYLMTAFNIWHLNRDASVLDSTAAGTPAAHCKDRHRLFVYLKLSVVMGLSWILEVVSFLVPGFGLWYLTDAYNALIGVFIFLIFVCKRKIIRKLAKLCIRNKTKLSPSLSRVPPGITTQSSTSLFF